MMKTVWELRIDVYDACDDLNVKTGIYSGEEAGLRALQEWLSHETRDEDEPENRIADLVERVLSREELSKAAQDYFDRFPPREGPTSWELLERTIDEPMESD